MRWSLNPFSFLFDREQAEQEPFGPDQTSILDLPPEIRNHIWRDLADSDHWALRQVCRRFKWEIENILGVKVRLHGPRTWRDWTFGDEARFICSLGSPDHAGGIAENIDWIQGVLVRSLELKRVTSLTFDPMTLIQSNRYMFRRLVIDLELGSPRSHVLQLLRAYDLLQVIHLSARALKPKLTLNELQEYRLFAVDLGLDFLQVLPGRVNLKELSVTAADGIPYTWAYGSFRGLPIGPIAEVNYPCRLQALSLTFPILLPDSSLQAWKPLLDSQSCLRDLSLNFGFLYWEYFLPAIRRSLATLLTLDIALGNYRRHRPTINPFPDQVPDQEQFSWYHMLGGANELRKLRLTMSNVYPRFMETPHSTRHLQALQLPNLASLELNFVALEQVQLSHIMTNWPSLNDLTLSYWNAADLPDYAGVAQEFFSAVAGVLPSGRFQRMKMTDWCTRSYPQVIMDQISGMAGYEVTWPQGTMRTCVSYFVDWKNVFKVRRTD